MWKGFDQREMVCAFFGRVVKLICQFSGLNCRGSHYTRSGYWLNVPNDAATGKQQHAATSLNMFESGDAPPTLLARQACDA